MKTCIASLLAAAVLAGCGGGLYLEFSDDDPPSVSLASGSSSAAPGQAVRLAAAASDDDYVTEVVFYRVEANGSTTFLGADGGEPYEWNALIPSGAVRGSTVLFFARAYDSVGQSRDSASVAVTVL